MSMFRWANRVPTEGKYAITHFNILEEKCVKVLENGAGILYFLNDRATQKHCPKVSSYYWTFVFKIGHCPAILHQKS